MDSYKFYIRGNTVNIRVNNGVGSKLRKSLGIKVDPELWDSDKGRAVGRSIPSRNVNDQILAIELLVREASTIEDCEKALSMASEKPSNREPVLMLGNVFRDYLEDCKAGKIKSGRRTIISEATIASLKVACTNYEDFIRSGQKDINCYEVDLFNVSQVNRVDVIRKVSNHFEDYLDYLIDMNYKPSTQTVKLQKLVQVINHIEKVYGLKIPNSIPTIKPHYDLVLPPDSFTDFVLGGGFNGVTELEKDCSRVIMIQFFTCSRIGDVLKLKAENFGRGDLGPFIKKIDEKTNSVSGGPIPEKLYDYCRENLSTTSTPFGARFSFLTDRTRVGMVNDYIEKKLRNTEIGERLVETVSQSPDGSIKRRSKPLYSVIRSHSIRKFAMNLYDNGGVAHKNIKSMSGHAKNSNVFSSAYLGVDGAIKNREIRDIQSSLSDKLFI